MRLSPTQNKIYKNEKIFNRITAFTVIALTAGAQAKTNSTDANLQQHDMHHQQARIRDASHIGTMA